MARAQAEVEKAIRRRAAQEPERTWLMWRDEHYCWRDALSAAQRAANGLLEIGVQPGERVAIMLPNCPEFIWLQLGLMQIGAHSVPVNTSQRGVTLRHILTDSGAATVLFDESLREVVLDAQRQVPSLRRLAVFRGPLGGPVGWTVDQVLAGADVEPPVEFGEAPGGVGLMYTSGTTGPPKGVVATQYDMAPLLALLRASGVAEGETMYTGLPLFHGNALLMSTFGSILLGARLALAPKFTASRFFDDCRRYEAVEFNTLGAMMSILLKQPPRDSDRDHQVRVAVSAGAPPDRWVEFERRFGVRIVEWFGMVDAPGILLNDRGKVGSMGRSGVAGIEFRVIGADDQGNNHEALPAGQIGELVFRHPRGRLTRYHNLPDLTDDAYREGWFHTGDLAETDTDGDFYYRGRKKESMRHVGENISAWEIETVLNAHPTILDSAAHAIASELGEDDVKVCVVVRPGASLRGPEVIEYCTIHLAKHAIPRYVEFMDVLPKTETQRNQYAVLRARGITPETWDRFAQ